MKQFNVDDVKSGALAEPHPLMNLRAVMSECRKAYMHTEGAAGERLLSFIGQCAVLLTKLRTLNFPGGPVAIDPDFAERRLAEFLGPGRSLAVTYSAKKWHCKLWVEHIFSDEGALGYLEGGAVPARIVSLTERGLVTDELKADLPPDELLDQVEFLTPAQIAAASEVLAENWGPMVADA